MKRILAVLLLLSTLCGCSNLVENQYYVTGKHSEQPSQTSQTEPPAEEPTVVSDRSDLRAAVLYCTRNWIEQDVFLVENYDGDFHQDLSEVLNHATQEDPIGAYAVDYIDVQLLGDTVSGSAHVAIVFRRSAAEVDSIITVNGTANALRRVQLALASYETSLTLRIRNYQETDFGERIRDYCYKELDKILVLPELSAEVYPKSGETRILELHFSYPNTREEMRLMLSSVNTTLSSAASYIQSGKDDRERLELLSRFLTTRFDYKIAHKEPTMVAYELLHDGLAHSLSFASVFRYECLLSGMDCWLVSGMKSSQPYYWNIVYLNGIYYHVDLMRHIKNRDNNLTLLTAGELLSEGYEWNLTAYPFTPEMQEPTQPLESNAPTELAEPTGQTTEIPAETEVESTEAESTGEPETPVVSTEVTEND